MRRRLAGMVAVTTGASQLIDRLIYDRVSTLRSSFTSEVEHHQKVRQGAA